MDFWTYAALFLIAAGCGAMIQNWLERWKRYALAKRLQDREDDPKMRAWWCYMAGLPVGWGIVRDDEITMLRSEIIAREGLDIRRGMLSDVSAWNLRDDA